MGIEKEASWIETIWYVHGTLYLNLDALFRFSTLGLSAVMLSYDDNASRFHTSYKMSHSIRPDATLPHYFRSARVLITMPLLPAQLLIGNKCQN